MSRRDLWWWALLGGAALASCGEVKNECQDDACGAEAGGGGGGVAEPAVDCPEPYPPDFDPAHPDYSCTRCVDGEWESSAPCCSWPPPVADCGAYRCYDSLWIWDGDHGDDDGCCPDGLPEPGTACDGHGKHCHYELPCGSMREVVCTEGAWSEWYDAGCCPDEQPEEGTPCPIDAESCVYSADGDCTTETICSGGAWTAPVTACSCTEATEGLCSYLSSCVWMWPGCADEGTTVQGCFEACSETAPCDFGSECTEVIHDPCHDDDCDQCAEPRSVCLPVTP